MATKTSRPRLGFLIAAAFALSATVMPTKVKAANFYFDNFGSNQVSDGDNWYTDPSLAVSYGVPPTSSDALFVGYTPAPSLGSDILFNDIPGSYVSLNFSGASGYPNYLVIGDPLSVGSISSLAGAYSVDINTAALILTGTPTITAGAGTDIAISPSVSTGGLSLTVAGSGNTTLISGVNLAAGGLIKQGAGLLTVMGTASYNGDTSVDAGILTFLQNVTLAGNVANSDGLYFQGLGTNTLTGTLSGTGGTYFSGAASIGTLNLTNPGLLTLNAGGSITTLNGAGTVDINGGTLTVAGGSSSATLTGTGGLTTTGSLTLSGLGASNYDGSTTVNVGSDLTFTQNALLNGNVTNNGTLDFGGTADLLGTLSGAGSNTITGLAYIDELNLGALGSLTLTSGGSITTLNGAGTVFIDGGTLTVGGGSSSAALAGVGGLTTTGSLTLTGVSASGYLGATTVNVGSDLTFTQNALLNGNVTNNGTLDFGGTADLLGTLSGAGSTTITGLADIDELNLGALGSLTLTSGGSITTLNGAGTVFIDGGTLTVGGGSSSAALAGVGGLTTTGSLTLTGVSASGYLGATTVNVGSDLTFTQNALLIGNVTNDGTLDFGGTADLLGTLSGAGSTSVTGAASISTLNLTNPGSLTLNAGGSITSLNGAGTVDINGGTLTVDGGNYFGALQGAGNLVKSGGGLLELYAQQAGDYTGTTTVNGGALFFNSSVTLAGQVTNNGYLLFNSGSGTTNTLTTGLDGGGFTQFTGEAVIGTSSGSGDISFVENATIGTLLGSGTITINPGKTLDVSSGNFSGTLQGIGGLTKSGPGVLSLSGLGVDDYVGSTTVNGGGILSFLAPVTLNGQVTNNNSWLFFYDAAGVTQLTTGLQSNNGYTAFAGDAVITSLNGSGTVEFWNPTSLQVSDGVYAGQFWGAGSLDKVSGGTLVLSGSSNNFSGDVNVFGGTLEVQSSRALGLGLLRFNGGNLAITSDAALLLGNNIEQLNSATVTLGAATVGATAVTQSLGDLSMRNGAFLNVQQDGSFAAGAPAALSVGTVTLDGPWNYFFNVGSGAKLEVRGAVNGVANNDLIVSGNGDTSIVGNLNIGSGELVKFDAGTLVLSGVNNTFSGPVNVYGGTLEARSDRALGTGLVRLDGGNLAITSDSALLLGNNVDQFSSATVTLGAATVGATAVTQSLGNLTMYNGVTLSVQQNGSFAPGPTATLSVGTVTLDSAWTYYFNVGSGAKLEVRGAVNQTLNNDLVVYGAGDTTITGNLNLGTGSLEKYDNGTLRLLSANTFSGNVDVYGGTLITANNGLQNVPQIYVHTSGTLNGVNYKTDADLAIDQGGTVTFSAAAPAITGTIWNNGSLTLNPALGGNSTITLNEFYGSGTTTITRGNLAIYNNALTLGPSVLDPFTYDNTLPADLTWGYGAGGGGLNSLTLIGTLTADISGGTVNTTNLFANYIFDVDMLGDYLNGTTGRPLGIAGPAMGGTNVFLNVNVSGAATVGRIVVDGAGTVNFAGTASVVTLENGQVNLTGTLGEFTNVEGGAITSTSADVKITNLSGGSHSFNGQSTTITNFTGGSASLNGVQALVTTVGGAAVATATSNISVGTMNGGNLTLQGSGPSSFITRLNGGTLNINGSDVLVTVNSGNSPSIGAGAAVVGNGSLTKLTVATLNLNTINLSGTIRHQEGIINVWGDNNSLGTVINSSTLSFVSNTGSNSIASLDNNSTGVINFATDSSIGALSGSGVLTINDATKTLTIQGGSFSGTISGTGNLFKSNAGVLVLSGTNVDNYTGQTTVNGGTLEFSSAVTLTGAVYNAGNLLLFTSATGTTTLSSLLNDFSATTIFTGASSVTNVTNANGSTLRFNGATNITGSLNNLFGGFVEINAGGTINVLQGDSVTRINNVGVLINQRFNDGELQVNSSSTINELFGNGRIALSNATLTVNSGATAGIIDGNGSLTKNSGGLLTLSGANVDNYSGSTNVNNGTLEFTHDAVTLAGTVSVGASGTLNFTAVTGTTQLNGGLVTSGNTTIGNNAILADTYNHVNTLSIVGNVTGSYFQNSNASATTVIGGTANLSHFRNYWGVMNINALVGSNSIGFLQNWGSTTMVASLTGNNLENHAGTTTIGGNATLGDVRTYGGTTSIGGNLINCNYLENYASTQVVGDASITSLRNFAGTTTIGGALSASDIVNNGGQLINVTGNANISNYLENNGTANFGSASTIASLFGSGTANFTGASQIANRSGNGTANFADDSSISNVSGNGSLTIANGKTLTISSGSFSGAVLGQGALTKNSAGTLSLVGPNVDLYQGSTTVNAGILEFDTAATLAGQVTNDATLNFNSSSGLTELTTGLAGSGTTNFAGDTSVGTLNGTGAATVSIANGKTLTVSNGSYAGLFTGAGSLVKANVGTLVFTGVNADDYQGSTTVVAGTLTFTQAVTLAGQVTNNATLNFTNAGNTALTTGLAGAGATSFSGDTSVGTLDGTNTASVSIAGGKVLTVNSGSFAGSLTGFGSLVKSTGGSLTLSGVGAGNYVGTTTVDAGTLEFTQNVTLLGQVTNNSTLNFGGAGTTTLTGGLTGSGITTFSGNGSITSRSGTGVVNFLGNVSIANVTGSGDLNIASGKSLTIQQGVYSGAITGSGDLVKTTGGELELVGSASSYGATVVQAGLLTVNSDVTTSGVIVAAGASLGGSGSINGNVVVNGFLAPGNSPGVLTVNGTETLANNSTFQAEIGGTTAGTGNNFHDQSNVNGNVVIGTGVDLDILSWNGFTSVARGDALTLVKATGGIAGTFADTAGSGLTGWTLFDNSSSAAHQFGNLYGTGLSAGQTFGVWGTNANRAAVAGALWTTAVTETTNSATTAGANRVGFIDTNSNAGRAALALVNAGANTDALLDSYSPESFLGLTDYAQMTARTLADGALNQTTSYTLGDWGVGAGYSSVANTFTAGSSSAFDRRLSSNTTYANFSYHLNPRWKAGLFFGHNVGSINSAANSTNINGNVVGLSLNGSVDWHYPVSLKAAISSSSLRFGSNRSMVTATSGDDQIVSGTGTSSAADTKLTDTSAQVSASMLVYTKGRLSLSPSVGLVYGTSKTDAFTETGTGANLAVAGMSSNSTRGVIGLGVGYEVSAELALSMSLGLEKKLNSDADSVSATFAGARDANFSVVGRDTSGSVISTLGLGISYRLPDGYSANLNAEFRSANPFHNDKRVNLSINRRF